MSAYAHIKNYMQLCVSSALKKKELCGASCQTPPKKNAYTLRKKLRRIIQQTKIANHTQTKRKKACHTRGVSYTQSHSKKKTKKNESTEEALLPVI